MNEDISLPTQADRFCAEGHKPTDSAQKVVCAYHNNLVKLKNPIYYWSEGSDDAPEDENSPRNV